MMRPVAVDVSELMRNPVATGIQRVTREILRWWPGPRALFPVTLDAERGVIRRVTALGNRNIERLLSHPSRAAALRTLASLRRPMAPGAFAALLNPEVYYDVARSRLYEDVGRRIPVLAVAYDFLPQLAPEYFAYGSVTNTMSYVRWLRSLDHITFISERSRNDFVTRIARRKRDTWKTFALGADGLGTAEPFFETSRNDFLCLGTIEPRKNHAAVLAAFEQLWAEGVNVKLTFVGRTGWAAERLIEDVRAAQARRPFRWIEQSTDRRVRELIRSSRATIFASKAEGYGLPAVESLALGVPVIVTASLPSVEGLPSTGQVRLASVNPSSIALAVRELLDDDWARQRTMEIATLSLPTWRGFAGLLAAWVDDVIQESTQPA